MDLDPAFARAALDWLIECGADEAIAEAPVDRTALPASLAHARAPAKPQAPEPPAPKGTPAEEATRTQQMEGEAVNVGAEYSDPYAVSQQLVHGGTLGDRTMHLWRFDLPRNLRTGQHTAEVTATDSYGREFTDVLEFEVVGRR